MPPRANPSAVARDGLVVASHGRHYRVEFEAGAQMDCATRGKKSDVACGDHVRVLCTSQDTGVIDTILPRTTLLYRSDAHRQKLVAANVTQALIVLAPVPSFYDDLLSRCLAACEHQGVTPLIVLNKTDLPQSAAASAALDTYRKLGYQVIGIAAKHEARALIPLIEQHTSVLVGQSGMGKSTIINRLLPEAASRVADISHALDSGRHTTTGARLYHLGANSHLIDSPGMQVFGLHHLSVEDTMQAFVEFRALLGQCRFRDCLHLSEPDCAIANACAEGSINTARLASYRGLVQELQRAHARRFD